MLPIITRLNNIVKNNSLNFLIPTVTPNIVLYVPIFFCADQICTRRIVSTEREVERDDVLCRVCGDCGEGFTN